MPILNTSSNVKVGPHKSLLRSITTFNELDEYITVLTSVLDYIDRFVGHHFFTDYSDNGTFRITKNTHGVAGYDLKLLKHGMEIACIGYYNLDPDDVTWAKCYDEGHTHIYAFQQHDEQLFDYQGMNSTFISLPCRIEDYNETMYEQLEFVYPKEQVNVAMCIAKLDKSDSTKEHRQFVIYESPTTDYRTILEELKEFVYIKTMIQGGFE